MGNRQACPTTVHVSAWHRSACRGCMYARIKSGHDELVSTSRFFIYQRNQRVLFSFAGTVVPA